MFGFKLKQQCQILSDENLTLKIEIDQLRAEHKKVCEENQQIQQQLTSAQSREHFFLGMFANLANFGQSLQGLGDSFSGLTVLLNQQKIAATSSSRESETNRLAFQQMANNLQTMFEQIKHNMETIAGIEIYPVLSLLIFFFFFVGLAFWVFSYKKETIQEMSNIPLEDNPSV